MADSKEEPEAKKPATPKKVAVTSPKKTAKAPKQKPSEASKAPEKKMKRRCPRNRLITKGIMRYSRSTMFHKRAVYLKKKPKLSKKAKNPPRPRTIVKPIGGEKNGGKRVVKVFRSPRYYPTEDRPKKKKSSKTCFSKHKRYLRPSITPGTILILLAGVHKRKRVVFLKQLSTGLLLVTGPYAVNGCPLRRINQIYVIATKTKLNISKVKIPNHLNDSYFKRKKAEKSKNVEGEIFDSKKEIYQVTEERKKDQIEVDKKIMNVIAQSPDKKLLFAYLSASFSLRNHQYPHKMLF